ncbi:hypothetical protein ACT453_59710, partial [Bacillus sp. D-CC]
NFFIRNMLEPFNVKDLSSLNIIIVTPIDLLTKTINLNSLKADIAHAIPFAEQPRLDLRPFIKP